MELKNLCKKYRQKKQHQPEKDRSEDHIDGDPVNDTHDETGDEINEEDDARSVDSSIVGDVHMVS